MRKPFLLVVLMVLALSTVAYPVAAGPGGTIYFSSGQGTNTLSLYYVQIGTNWKAVGGAVLIGTITNNSYQALLGTKWSGAENDLTGRIDIWDPGTGIGDATLLLGAYYNTTPALTTSHSSVEPMDVLLVQKTATVGAPSITVINDGSEGHADVTNYTVPRTLGANIAVKVGSDLMGTVYGTDTNGAALSKGILTAGNYLTRDYIWTDNNLDNVYDQSQYELNAQLVEASANGADVEYYQGKVYSVGDSTGTNYMIYNDGDDLQKVDIDPSNLLSAGDNLPYALAVGDTNAGTIDDLYVHRNVGAAYGIYKWEDTTGNGSFDTTERTLVYDEDSESGTQWIRFTKNVGFNSSDMELVKSGSKWFLLVERNSEMESGILVIGLNSDGVWDGEATETMWNRSQTTGDTTFPAPANMAIGDGGSAGYFFEFVPVPEPATMLLVGSGVLGLAGVVRRRMMK